MKPRSGAAGTTGAPERTGHLADDVLSHPASRV